MKINLRSPLIFLICTLSLATCINGQRISETESRYSSLDGLFSILVPPRVSRQGGGPLEPYFTENLGSSYSTYWTGDDLYLQAGYVRFKEPEKVTDTLNRDVLSMLVKRITDRYRPDVGLKRRDIVVNKIPVVELSHQNTDGEKIVFRLYLTEVGVVRIFASFMPGSAASKAEVFLQSLESPSKASILEEKLREATPKALPPCSKDLETVNGLVSERLFGRVKSVATFNEVTKNGSVERTLDSRAYFDELGRMLKSENFEFGRPDTVNVYGCIDGKEASKWGAASYENRFFGTSDRRTGGEPPDTRYELSYKAKYDSKRRIVQVERFNNRGLLLNRSQFIYSENSVTVDVTDYDGKLDSRIKTISDRSDRISTVVDQTFLEGGGEWRQTYNVLSWDSNGNWTKRSRTGERFDNGKLNSTNRSVEIREITYF